VGHPPLRGPGDGPCDLLRNAAVGKAEDDDVGPARQLGQVTDELGSRRAPLRSGNVVAHDRVARLDEIPRQDASHVAEADEADRVDAHSRACSSARTASRDRRAETPAGAPQ
jgi:hypothetical protein